MFTFPRLRPMVLVVLVLATGTAAAAMLRWDDECDRGSDCSRTGGSTIDSGLCVLSSLALMNDECLSLCISSSLMSFSISAKS